MIGKKFKHELVPNGREICEKQLFNLIDRMEKVDIYNEEIESFLPTIYKKLAWLEREELIKRFVSREFNYFLDYYKNTKDINVHEKDDDKKGKGAGNYGRRDRTAGIDDTVDANMCRFFLNLGRKNDLTPQLLIGLVNEISRRFSIKIGKIDIMHSFSFFEADVDYKDEILNSFNKKLFKGQKIIAAEAEPFNGPAKKFKENDSKKKEFSKKEFSKKDFSKKDFPKKKNEKQQKPKKLKSEKKRNRNFE
jgi:ATP-dependent RNA helicase DeaD